MVYSVFPTSVPGPSYPIDKQSEPRIKKVAFGDGYTQQAPDGLNSIMYTWSLNWEVLTTAEKNTIEAFIVSMGGYQTFQWVDPDSVTWKVKCPTWTTSAIQPGVYKITATFKQYPI